MPASGAPRRAQAARRRCVRSYGHSRECAAQADHCTRTSGGSSLPQKRNPVTAAPHLDAGLSEAIQALVGGVVPAEQVAGWLLARGARPAPTANVSALTAKILRDPRSLFIAGLDLDCIGCMQRTSRLASETDAANDRDGGDGGELCGGV